MGPGGGGSFPSLSPSTSSPCPTHVLPDMFAHRKPPQLLATFLKPLVLGDLLISHCLWSSSAQHSPSIVSNCEVLRWPCEWLRA